jgi:hypothetical protein
MNKMRVKLYRSFQVYPDLGAHKSYAQGVLNECFQIKRRISHTRMTQIGSKWAIGFEGLNPFITQPNPPI